jgi:hypothetical protein
MERQIISRAIELAGKAGEPVPAAVALRRAIDERCKGDYQAVLEMLVGEGLSKMKDARQRTYNLPEQATLFDLPGVIALMTPLGDLFVPADMATAGQVDQWAREGEQHHGSQHKRFKAMRAQLKGLSLDPSRNYREQLKELGDSQ